MVNLSSNNSNNVRISAGGQRNINVNSPTDNNINANNNGNSQRARSWAIGEGLIDGEDYSAKYWAEQAKISEEIARESIDAENNAQIWAEGTDEEVEAIGGTHSSKGWVDYVIENAPTASVEETEQGAVLTVTDINGTTTATIYNGADGQDGQDGAPGQDGRDGADGQDGQDGFSPIATVSKSGNTATISITDANGTTTTTITDGTNGTNGTNGQDGQDGYSPTATVTKSGSVATITITDKNGTTTANVYDGTGGGGGIQNTATGTDSLTILGTPTSADYSVNIGVNSEVTGDNGIALGNLALSVDGGIAIGQNATTDGAGISIGYQCDTVGFDSIAIGYGASSTENYAIQIGPGRNTTANSFQVATYQLLDTTTGLIPDARLSSNVCTTNTAQNISGRKTFLGEKAIYFKQSATTNKLGFTLYNPSDTELGAFEYRPNTVSGNALLNVNTSYSNSCYVGFRYWGTAVNIIAPKVATAGDYYIPVNITDGNTTVTANSSGTLNISSLLPTVPTNVSAFTNDSGYITGITSTDITTALGYTPYNSTNPNGYISGITSPDVTTALGYTPVDKAGDTMTGTLTIDKSSNTDYIYLDSTDIQRGVTPSANKYIMLKMRDKNDDLLAQYYYRLDTNGKPRAHMTCYNNDGSKQAVVMTGFDANDNAECSFPNTTCVDGQWVNQSVDLASNVSMAASGSKNYSLSSYLPNDGAIYEVKFSIEGETGNASGNGLEYRAYSDVLTSSTRGGVIAGRTRSNSTMLFASSFILPIGSARKIYIDNSNSSSSSTLVYLRAQGYRRVGTNA